MSKNLKVFKSYLDNTITLDQVKETIKEKGWPDTTINGYLDNLHKVTLTYDKLCEICFDKPNKVETAVQNLLKNFSNSELELITFKLMQEIGNICSGLPFSTH
jgi:hypothetical protein